MAIVSEIRGEVGYVLGVCEIYNAEKWEGV